MSGESSLPFDTQKAKTVFAELMKTSEGRELADKIREKLKDLNSQFKNLSPDDKRKFSNEFQGKFAETFNELKNVLKQKFESEEKPDEFIEEFSENYEQNTTYFVFIVAILIILMLFG